jgi:hypothetical protein
LIIEASSWPKERIENFMATTQQLRQSQLFAAEDWRVIYTAFTQVNFNAYDFPTIRNAMVDYIRLNYPEDFNDWIESSEFVALIDLLAYLGQSLAFRMDLNTRENFIETATRRESIFRLARMLSYQPQRCIPASGLIKITSVVTDKPLYDSAGINLQNITIVWNDQNNPDWYEQFILVINATLNTTNIFGNPVKAGYVNDIPTELYSMNNTAIPTGVIPFSISVAGNTIPMELANPNFNDGTLYNIVNSGSFYEIDPDPLNAWNIIYRDDGNGYSSATNGFFLYFKQGIMQFQDYACNTPIANRIIDVNADNVNQTDTWVQNIDNNGLVTKKWTRVPSTNGFNVIYNSLENSVRDVFSIISRDNAGNDQISIRFADGNFGNIPLGIIRVWYRISNNLSYQIRPADLSNQVFAFGYVDDLANTWNVAFTTNLTYTVNNAQSTESNAQIAQNAPQLYYTQDRMVNGEDYNLFPLQDSRILKVKAVNRVYSGQSRYLDITDPTGYYNNLNVICTDGILYQENDENQRIAENSPGVNYSLIVSRYIQPLLNGSLNGQTEALELKNFYYYNYPRITVPYGYTWQTITSLSTSCTGAFFVGSTAVPTGPYAGVNNAMKYITSGALVYFDDGVTASVSGVVGDGTGINLTGKTANNTGAVSFKYLLTGTKTPSKIIPSFRTTLLPSEISQISTYLALHKTFGIRYDQSTLSWQIVTPDNINVDSTMPFSMIYSGDTSSTNKDSSWLLKIEWNSTGWKIYSRALRYIFESNQQTRFYFESMERSYDPITSTAQRDYISILQTNPDPITGLALSQDYLWQITGQQIEADGYTDPSSVRVTMWEGNNFGVPDDPDQYNEFVDPSLTPEKMLFWQRINSVDGYQYWAPISIPLDMIYASATLVPPVTLDNYQPNDLLYIIDTATFLQYQSPNSNVLGKLVDVSDSYKMRIGRNNISFLWKHYAPQDVRINPAVMNIIDMFVLTNSYDTDLRNWISTNGAASDMPMPPSNAELTAAFNTLENFKQMTDQVVWHPVKYKVLFGSQAAQEYRTKFLVVKATGSTLSDNEVKSLVIQAVNQYFSISNWDFGASFFFTELAAYIHQKLATIVGSVVILPLNAQAKFGDLFEIICDPDEIPISCARVTDVQVVASLNETVLGI